jgi:ATP-dependent 26S proteasome regulatory subunit
MLMGGTGGTMMVQSPHHSESLRELLANLRRIDRLIHAQVATVRQRHKSEDQFQGLFIPEKEVDELLARPPGAPRFDPAADGNAPSLNSIDAGENSASGRLQQLGHLLGLSPFEMDCLLICLAPEIDPRYERLYAYLQDDVTKRRPSVDLVLNLLCATIESKMEGRQRFLYNAPLVRHRLLQLFEDPSQPKPTLLGRYIRIDERIVNYLLESDEPDNRLQAYLKRVEPKSRLDSLVMPSERKARLARLLGDPEARRVILYLQGPYGSGKQATAEALCRKLNLALLVVDGKRLATNTEADFQLLLQLASREAVLQSAALYWSGFDALLAEDKSSLLSALLGELGARLGATFLSGEIAWHPADELRDRLFIRLEVPRPLYAERRRVWDAALDKKEEIDIASLATKFRFTPGEIQNAVTTARNLARWRDPDQSNIMMADLYEGCRLQSNRKLSALARKIKPNYTWNDIILPPDRVQQLREICNSVKYRSVVYDQWGFDRKLSLGKGLNILFAGPPGTGKTMAAEIIAGELALDLYKIDLSSVVSKYIGETEKNLARIFSEAETSNAILFFDEADALFGKRSEVRDSHDRYANIEVGYLLQRMEEYEGVVILATNFRKNMDEAFVRRVHFTVEFPFPDEADRRRIWETIWPKEAPRNADVDLEHVARSFEIAGGNIRNIALGAAFLAAENGGAVNMRHLLHATRREYQKMGKVVLQGE